MDRGMYVASSGGLVSARRLEVVSNNLANVSTVGFKAERIIARQQEFSDTLASQLSNTTERAAKDHERTPGVVDIATYTDFTPGPIATTGNPLDVALNKQNQFFVVGTPDGPAYTRAGNFTMNAERQIVTQDGLPVQGDGGPLELPPGKISISGDGTVVVGGQTIGRLQVVEIDELDKLKRTEGVRFQLPGGGQATAAEKPEVVSEAVEMPNVSVVDAMVEMITAQKGFEAYTKTIRTIDELNDRAIRNARAGG